MSRAVGLTEADLESGLTREDIDIGYQRKEKNGESTVYELGFSVEDEVEEYLGEIEVEGYCDVENIALDFENGRAAIDTEDIEEEFDKMYQRLENSDFDFFGHTYGQEIAAIDSEGGEAVVHDGQNDYKDSVISSRIELFDKVYSQYSRAMDIAEGTEYSSVVTPSDTIELYKEVMNEEVYESRSRDVRFDFYGVEGISSMKKDRGKADELFKTLEEIAVMYDESVEDGYVPDDIAIASPITPRNRRGKKLKFRINGDDADSIVTDMAVDDEGDHINVDVLEMGAKEGRADWY